MLIARKTSADFFGNITCMGPQTVLFDAQRPLIRLGRLE